MGIGSSYSNGPIIQRFRNYHHRREEEDKNLFYNSLYTKIIDFSDVQKGDIYINLIHYDKNLKKKENFEYYRYFSIKVIGSYCSFDDYDMLKLFLSRLLQVPFCPSYILMISGAEAINILKEFHDYEFLNDIIIFCFEKNKYSNLKKTYKKIKLTTNNFVEVRNFLKSKKHSKDDLNMDNHLFSTPMITYFDYKKAIFPIHRILAYFFDSNFNEFSYEYYKIAKTFINKTTETSKIKNKIIEIMEKLVYSGNFPVDCIKYYSGEHLCYIFNRALRNFEKNYVEMAYFIGPFYFGILNYSLFRPEKQLNKKKILYRDITIDRLDLYSYQFCEKDIICFPSFTSTTVDMNLDFEPSNNANLINNDQIEEKGFAKMIINYDPKGKCISPGVDISQESEFSEEREVLLFPFTFFRIDKVEIHSGKENDKHIIYLTIINKGDFLEYGLKERKGFKLIENGTKLVIDYTNKSNCDNNELYYKMNFDYIDKDIL